MSWLRHEYFDKLTHELMAVEVMPEKDLKEHNSSQDCECIPILKIQDGKVILIHNSFDGREQNEKGH